MDSWTGRSSESCFIVFQIVGKLNDGRVRTPCPCHFLLFFFSSFLLFRCAVASLYEVVSVRPSVRRSVRRSVCPVLFSKVKSTRTRRILCRVSGLVREKSESKTPDF